MRNSRRIKIAFDMCVQEGVKSLLGIVVVFAAFVMFGCIFMLLGHNMSYTDRIETGLKVPYEKVGYINIDSMKLDYEEEKEVIGLIQECDEIESLGHVSYGIQNTSRCISFLGEIQYGHQTVIPDNEYNVGEMIETYIMSAGAWDIMNLRLQEGAEPSQLEPDDNTILLYLSERYSGLVSVGEHYYDTYEDGTIIYDYVVAGFFSSDSYILANGTANSTNNLIDAGCCSMDYAVVEVPGFLFNTAYFSTKDGGFSEVKEYLGSIAQNYGIDIDMYELSSVLKFHNDNTAAVTKYLIEIAVLFTAAAVLLLIGIQIGRVISHAKEYGIWLTNGALFHDIALVTIYQNIIYVILPMILSCFAVRKITDMILSGNGQTAGPVISIFWEMNVPLLTVLAVILTAVTAGIPIILLYRKNAAELLKGETAG